MNNFRIIIRRKIFFDGEDHDYLIAVLKDFGAYCVDNYTSTPDVMLWPKGKANESDLPVYIPSVKDGVVSYKSLDEIWKEWQDKQK